MDILFVGFSSIVQRKVLQAALKSPAIGNISVATRSQPDFSAIPGFSPAEIYDNYDDAIARTASPLVYISFPNALHAPWAEKALRAGRHVIVDKPAFLNYQEAERLFRLADESSLMLAEANVWNYHALFSEIKSRLNGRQPHSVYANFSSPPLDEANFRYIPEMGAGILYDRGSYAVRCARELFKGFPVRVYCSQRFSDSMANVDTDLAVMMEFEDRATFLGFFSLECEYTNSLEVIGADFRIRADRIFTPPPDIGLKLEIQQKNSASVIEAPACDTFQIFLEDVVDSINDSTCKKFNELLLDDARMFEQILDASQQQGGR